MPSTQPGIVIAVMNRKGGVGKSTSVAHIAASIARQKQRGGSSSVLIVDADSQGHAGKHLGVEPHHEPHLGNVIYEGLSAVDSVVDTEEPCVKLVRGAKSLRELDYSIGFRRGEDASLQGEGGISPYRVLCDALNPLREKFSYILVDCPPGAGLLHTNIYHLADFVLTPSEADAGAIEGIGDLMEELEEARNSLGAEVQMLGIFFVKTSAHTREHRENMREMREALGNLVFKAHVRASTRMREAWRERMLITRFAPRSAVSQDYEAVTREVVRRIRNVGKGR